MPASLASLVAQMQRWTSSATADASDAVLLERFVRHREESAFVALLSRHGNMVLRTCRRILGDVHEAEDAFQATFLILARQAHALKNPQALPGFLHSIARRVALRARAKSAIRPRQTPLSEALPDVRMDLLSQLTARELLTAVDEEVGRLPAAQRSAVLLCCLEGRTREEAAHLLGCTAGSLKGHLERGRRNLQARLARRGIALSAALAVMEISRGEAVSALTQRGVVQAVMRGGSGTLAAKLAESVLHGMSRSKCAGISAVVIMVGLGITAAGLTFSPAPVDKAVAEAPSPAAIPTPRPHLDALGDPLPAGAIARLGTVRLRHGDLIRFAAFTPDGKRLVSAASDGVRVWDVATGKELRHFAPEAGREWGATDLSPDGERLVAAVGGDADGQINFWDMKSGKKSPPFGRGYYDLVRFSPNGKLLAASGRKVGVELWDATARRKRRTWKAHGVHQVMRLLFSADSRQLLTSGNEGKVRLWDPASGQQLQEFTRQDWKFSDYPVFAQAESMSPDGKIIAVIETNEKRISKTGEVQWTARISLHDAASGERVRQLSRPTPEVHFGPPPQFSAVAFIADGKKLLTGGPDQFLRVWDATTGKELRRWPLEFGCPYSLHPSPDGKTAAAVMNQGKSIQILNVDDGKPHPSPAGHLAHVYLSALTPDGRTAITMGHDGALQVWDAVSGRVRRRLKGHDELLYALRLIEDGRMMLTGGWDKTVRVWNLAAGTERRRIALGGDSLPCGGRGFALSPGGGTLAVMNFDGLIRLFDVASGRESRRIQGPKWIRGSAFTADGRSLAVWDASMQVRIWDITDGRLLHRYPLPQDLLRGKPFNPQSPQPGIFSSAASPNGRLLAIAINWHANRAKNYLVFKDLLTGRDVRRIDNLPAEATALAFSPDGRMLAWSGMKDWTIHLVETASGGERYRLVGHRGQVLTLVFSAEGKELISGSLDTTALVWDLGRRLDSGNVPATLSAQGSEALWTDLAGDDAARAYRAIRKLASSPTSTISFLRKRLHPIPPLDEKRIARLISDLDSDDFPTRQKTAAELHKLGELPLPAYRRVLESKPSIELRRRVEQLVDKAEAAWWAISPKRLRALRAVEALELAGTPEARELLDALAAGAAGARLTEEAKAARKRLTRR